VFEDIGCYEEILETADTIEGNSVLKANYVTESMATIVCG
jgi:XTP/dITP diphosphohydrolase